MADDDVAGDALREVLAKRTSVLSTLAGGTWHKPALVEELDVSRSTVDRAIEELEAAGLVDRDGGAFTTTHTGEVALAVHLEYAGLIDDIADAAPILDAIPAAAPLDPALLENGDVRLADPHAPESTLHGIFELLPEVDRLRGFAPIIKSGYATPLLDQVLEGRLELEMIIERDARESMSTVAESQDDLAALLEAEAVSVLETDEDLPYALWLMEGEAADYGGVTVHDDGGLVGVVTNDDPAALDWCQEQYERVRGPAEQWM